MYVVQRRTGASAIVRRKPSPAALSEKAWPTLAAIEEAAARIRDRHPPSPLLRSPILSRLFDADVWLKVETLSPVASFKLRGALNAIARIVADGKTKGVVTASTGNHGQGVAYAAGLFGIAAHVFVPTTASTIKKSMMRLQGAVLHPAGEDIDEAKAAARSHAEKHGFAFIDDGESRDVILGAGTVGLEVAHSMARLDILLVPVGSGSLAGGTAAAVKAIHPGADVIGVQSAQGPAMAKSFAARRAVEAPAATIAEGLHSRVPAKLALAAMLDHVDDVWLAEDEELLAAVHSLFLLCHILVEPSGAAALAGAWRHRLKLRGKTVVLVLTGANIRDDQLSLALRTPPRPGLSDLANAGANGDGDGIDLDRVIRPLGTPGLRERAAEVATPAVPAIREDARFLQSALVAFRSRHGFGRGIAAPQVGIPRRLVALNLKGVEHVLVNPRITAKSRELFEVWDDCMCFPHLLVRLLRHVSVDVEFEDLDGKTHKWPKLPRDLSELLQHEIDHLDGVLAIDLLENPRDLVYRDARRSGK